MHFFTGQQGLANQTTAYGSIDADNFRVTSLHDSTNTSPTSLDDFPPAYAVTKGRICALQVVFDPDTNQTLTNPLYFNIVLQPDPGFAGKTPFPAVKYFIYRGIKIDSVVTGPSSGTSFLTNQPAYSLVADKLAGGGSRTGSNYLFYDISGAGFNEITELEHIFYNVDLGQQIKLHTVEEGMLLGRFKAEGFGFEILFDDVGFNPTIGMARGVNGSIHPFEHKITVPSNTSAFQTAIIKEEVVHYCDPCAFFGSYAKEGIHQGGGLSNPLYDLDVYNDLLSGKFASSGRTYVDIRDRTGFSYQYFNHNHVLGDFTDNLELTYSDADPDESSGGYDSYADYRHVDGWPLLVLDNTQMPVDSGDNTKSAVQIAFAREPGDKGGGVFLDSGEAVLNSSGSVQHISSGNRRMKYLKNERSTATNFGQGLGLRFPRLNGGVTMPTHMKMRYVRYYRWGEVLSYTPADDYPMYPVPKSRFDFLFDYDMDLKWKNILETQIVSTVYYEGAYFDDTDRSGGHYIANVGMARDGKATNQKIMTFFVFDPSGDVRPDFNAAAYRLVDRTFPGELTNSIKRTVDNLTFIEHLDSKCEEFKLSTRYIYDTIANLNSNSPVDIKQLYLDKVAQKANEQKHDDPSSVAQDMQHFKFFEIRKPDYDTIKSLTLTGRVDNTRAYISFKRVSAGFSVGTDKTPYEKYEVVVNYIKSGSPPYMEEQSTGVYVFKVFTKATIEKLFDLVRWTPDLNDPDKLNGYSIDSASNQNSGNDYTINCNVYLIKDEHLSDANYQLVKDWVEENITEMWSTSHNNGLIAPLKDGNNFVDPVDTISTSGINVLDATPDKIAILGHQDVLIRINSGDGRSHIDSKKRKGQFYWDAGNNETFVSVNEKARNVPAHEFGHLLGLDDRYGYVARIDSTANKNIETTGANVFAGNRALFIPYSIDDHYSMDFRWRFNLMSTQKCVPTALGAPMLDWLHPKYTDGASAFITPFQWAKIIAREGEGLDSALNYVNRIVFFITAAIDSESYIGYTYNTAFHCDQGSSAPNDSRMDDGSTKHRDNGAFIVAGFSPFLSVNNGPSISSDDSENEYFKQRLRIGRDLNEHTEDLDQETSDQTLGTYTASSQSDYNTLGLSAVNSTGLDIWNKVDTSISEDDTLKVYSNADGQNHNHSVSLNGGYENRLTILKIIKEGKLSA